MGKKEELSEQYSNQKTKDKNLYTGVEFSRRKLLTTFDAYELEDAFEAGWDAACEDADGVRGHIKLWKEEFLDRAAEFMELYILNHENIDIFEMEEEFRKAMEE